MDKRSQLACLSQCRELLQQGASVLFFPEGTRATDMRLQDFKKVICQPFLRTPFSRLLAPLLSLTLALRNAHRAQGQSQVPVIIKCHVIIKGLSAFDSVHF